LSEAAFHFKKYIMRDIADDIQRWMDQGKVFALATVIKTWRSAPRQVGSCMAISDELQIIGSVSGGCVEGEVVKRAQEVIKTQVPTKIRFGVSNDDAWNVGLSCGGAIEIFLEPFPGKAPSIWKALLARIDAEKPSVLVKSLDASGTQSLYGAEFSDETMADPIRNEATLALKRRESKKVDAEGVPIFLHSFPTQPHLIMIGAAHITVDLTKQARLQGFRTTVIDPRGIFSGSITETDRPDKLHAAWPQEILPELSLDDSTYVAILSHDTKIDDPALHILLRSQVAYIGALGSRKTQAKRKARLLEAGFSETEVARIHGPIGLDIGALTPAEIALSVMAEVVRVGRS
ncbi:MAG: XdhC family protein, partial [Saprospiraceae bacterium]|nr:XdhC family protein [Saprospiraceae bacterium]